MNIPLLSGHRVSWNTRPRSQICGLRCPCRGNGIAFSEESLVVALKEAVPVIALDADTKAFGIGS